MNTNSTKQKHQSHRSKHRLNRGHMVRLDRSIALPIPSGIQRLCHLPCYEDCRWWGFDLANIELLHVPSGGLPRAMDIYESYRAEGLTNHLKLGELVGIQAQGAQVYTRYFGRKCLYAWGDVIEVGAGFAMVPYLYVREGIVKQEWKYLINKLLTPLDVAGRFIE